MMLFECCGWHSAGSNSHADSSFLRESRFDAGSFFKCFGCGVIALLNTGSNPVYAER
ncbi:MAG: hypothetical protein ACLSDO_01510 [Anaerotruncus colihominis]